MTPRSRKPTAGPESGRAVAALCPKCALCCNGVLFRDVALQWAETIAALELAGADLVRKQGEIILPQPCACLNGNRCRIYADRPNRCRTFECGLLQRVVAGAMTENQAQRRIRSALRRVAQVKALLQQLGNADENQPLTRRYAQLMSEPIDLAAGPQAGARRAALAQKMDELMELLHREFLQ